MNELLELLEVEGERGRFIRVAGGPRITNMLAVELGCDVGFGRGACANGVTTFVVRRMGERVRSAQLRSRAHGRGVCQPPGANVAPTWRQRGAHPVAAARVDAVADAVVDEVKGRFLERDVREAGCARVRRDACSAEYMPPFSGKAKGLGPSCHARRLDDWTLLPGDELPAPVSHR